jgi:ADP-heptose:LPS heptosyltransferase
MKRGSQLNRFLDRYVGIPVLGLFSLLNRKQSRPSSIAQIGVFASPALGDTLLSSAALIDIRGAYPSATITFLASPGNKAAARLLPCVDRIATLELTNPVKAIRAIRRCRLDLLVDLTAWQRLTAFYSAASGAKYRVGFESPGQHRHYAYDLTATHSNGVHEVENFRELIRTLGIKTESGPAIVAPDEPPPVVRGKDIVFHPWPSGTRSFLREWPVERWTELAERLSGPDTHFYITGAPYESARCQELADKLNRAGLVASAYIGSDGLGALALFLKRARLVVTVNTGIMHLAAIAGARTIALNGPTPPHRWGPVGPFSESVQPRGAAGFLHLGFEFSGNPTDCMERTFVEDVLEAARRLESQALAETHQSSLQKLSAAVTGRHQLTHLKDVTVLQTAMSDAQLSQPTADNAALEEVLTRE